MPPRSKPKALSVIRNADGSVTCEGVTFPTLEALLAARVADQREQAGAVDQ